MKREIFKQLRAITIALVEHSIAVAQNFPKVINSDILWEGFKDISYSLKEQKYEEIYDECLRERAYNFLLLDGAIVQMMYRFDGRMLSSHRLAFYSNPHIERYQDNPDAFEERYYGNELFIDMIEEKIIPFPFRFEFDNSDSKFIECDHPYSHSTFGNYGNCRMPVCSPVSPNRFIRFILRNFYFDKYKECLSDDSFDCSIGFPRTITPQESKLVHFNFS